MQSAQREAQPHIRSAADAIDAADLAFELVGGSDILLRNDVIDKRTDHPQNHHGVGACKARADERGHRDRRDIDFAGEQGLRNDRAGADADDLGLDAVFLQ